MAAAASERDPRPAAKLCARSAGRRGPRKALLSPRGLACPMARRDASLSLLLPNTRLCIIPSPRRIVDDAPSFPFDFTDDDAHFFGSMHACMQCNVFVNRFSLPPVSRSLGPRWLVAASSRNAPVHQCSGSRCITQRVSYIILAIRKWSEN